MFSLIDRILNAVSPKAAAGLIAAVSALSLAAALLAQFGFGLKPCDLCLMQRVPFGLNMALGLSGLFWVVRARWMIGVAGLSFLANSGIAFYHSGVERHWWAGLSGCSAPDMSGSIEDLIARIEQTDVTRCDEIPWEMFGLSMANYNVAMCLGLALACFIYLARYKSKPSAIDTTAKQPT